MGGESNAAVRATISSGVIAPQASTAPKRVPAKWNRNLSPAMQRLSGRYVYSASDLNNFLECAHITELDKLIAAGQLERPARAERVAILAEHGEAHERAFLATIEAAGHPITTIERGRSEAAIRASADATVAAMERGDPYIAQAAFFDGTWLGYADIIQRVETPSRRWDWSYEPVDAKLARSARPYFVLQLCNYGEQLERIQGTAPEKIWLYLGTPELRWYHRADFDAFYRRVKARFIAAVGSALTAYPYPVSHCDICAFDDVCKERRERDDHPSLIAFARRDQVDRLAAGEPPLTTMTAVAQAPDAARPHDMVPQTFLKLRRQAAVQCESRAAGEPLYRLLPLETARGLAALPPPDPADVFFDMEGDPFADGGLEYLFGWVASRPGEGLAFDHFWADEAAEERGAFERFIDFTLDRKRRNPAMHVYHYAPYEPTALKRLVTKYATRELELDELLRAETFVDLYATVRQGLVVPAYSIKDLEAIYWGRGRTGEVTTAMDSVLAYERWRRDREDEVREHIVAYNRIDCESTVALRDFLLERRDEAVALFGVPPPAPEREEKAANPKTADLRHRQQDLSAALAGRVPVDPSHRTRDESAVALLSNLIFYHWRDAKPVWWELFDLCSQMPEQLVESSTAIGDVSLVATRTPERVKHSLAYRFRYPPQQHKAKIGGSVRDGFGLPAGTVYEIDDDEGLIAIKRRLPLDGGPPIRALIPHEYVSTVRIEHTLCDFADDALAALDGAPPRYRAGRSILYREPPRIAGRPSGSPLQHGPIEIEDIKRLCRDLDESHLFIQGPPGSGKTWAGARLVIDLIKQGRRVGIAANSHKAIDNMLHEVEHVAERCGVGFAGIKKVTDDEDGYVSRLTRPCVTSSTKNESCLAPEVQLAAGTVWLFSDSALRERFDCLFIDEAGQVSLANALAMSTAAKNIVLLGDPLQLPQVSHGAQPEGAEVSVLEHLLGDDATIPPERGVFLTRSYRMHPSICRFISETIYDSRLESADECARQRLDAPQFEGAGLRFMAVDHDGEPTRSVEEAEAVARIVRSVLGGTYTASDGDVEAMSEDCVLVVAPYNAQVRLIREELARIGLPRVQVGTVDKFQGQQAPVVIYSMATPSAADVPHGLEFLFSRNRLNVAISRAKCWSVIVASPRLLDATCRTVDQMRLVNTLCRFVESAEQQT